MNSNFSTIDNYKIIKTLGTGFSGKVKLAEDVETKIKYAIKIVRLKNDKKIKKIVEILKRECKILQYIEHKSIIKLMKAKKGIYNSKSKKKSKVVYAVLELAPNGEIFDLIYNSGNFNPNVSRFYIKQLLEAINYLHSQNIAHRDLKPENILLDENLNLKLIDFGFSTIVGENEKSNTLIGTKTYMAPEIIYKKVYDARKVDIFAIGVILFTFYFGKPPFNDAKLDDVYYKTLLHNPKDFWTFHIKNSQISCSEDFIFLINNMLCLNYENRFSIEQVMNSKWMSVPIDIFKAKKDIDIYFKKMKNIISRNKMQILLDRETKSSSINFLEKDNYIIFSSIQDTSFRPHVILSLKNKEKVVNKILDAFYCVKEELNGEIIWNEEKNKFSLKFVNNRNNVVSIKVKFYIIEKKFGVDFLRTEGKAFDYYEIKKKIIDCMKE